MKYVQHLQIVLPTEDSESFALPVKFTLFVLNRSFIPGSVRRLVFVFSRTCRLDLEFTQIPLQWVPEIIFRG